MPYVRAIELELSEHARISEATRPTPNAAPIASRASSRSTVCRWCTPAVRDPQSRTSVSTSRSGSRVVLVGPSGSGKTTIADAVLGLLPISARAITIDDVDIFDVLPQWRRSVGYVPQDVVIIDDTVAANVALGWMGDQIDHERVWWALEKAQADAFVRELPQGVDHTWASEV